MRAFCSLVVLSAIAFAKPVKVDGGLIEGVPGETAGTTIYRGIPFAAPPTGDLRWQEPQPVKPWSGVRSGKDFGASCMQTNYPEGSLYRTELGPVSEDCLTLNVWTTAKQSGAKLPVMVWIHGGALTRGAGSIALYDGAALARKGVVVVTINYRLGAFGFLAHSELSAESKHHSSGNYGLLDQVAALEWVKRNISAFGGDPSKVTIFGESAGSWSVNCLMASPLAKGLMHRAIGESGAFFSTMKKLSEAETAGAKLGDVKSLRAKSAEEILKTTFPAASQGPVVDGHFLPAEIRTVFAEGKQNDIPLLAGFNADEATAFVPAKVNLKQLTAMASQNYKDLAPDYLKAYRVESDSDATRALLEAFRDQTFGWNTRAWGRAANTTGHHPAYLYFFSRVPPGPTAEKYGAYHASEIAYAFQNLGKLGTHSFEDADRQLSETMSQYWVNFAKSGDPNGPGLPKWPAYKKDEDTWLELGTPIRPRPALHKEKLDFFDRFNAKQ